MYGTQFITSSESLSEYQHHHIGIPRRVRICICREADIGKCTCNIGICNFIRRRQRSMKLVFAMSSACRLAILYLQENWSHGLTHSLVFFFNLITLLWILDTSYNLLFYIIPACIAPKSAAKNRNAFGNYSIMQYYNTNDEYYCIIITVTMHAQPGSEGIETTQPGFRSTV